MQESLIKCELFEGLAPELQTPLIAIARRQTLPKGEYVFMLGDHADRLFVLLQGKVEVCFPMAVGNTVKDVAVETMEAGRAFGVSAVIKPYRFTLSARAAEKSELATFSRADLFQILDADPVLGRAFMGQLVDVLGRRFLTMRALWGRELQRSINEARSTPGAKRTG